MSRVNSLQAVLSREAASEPLPKQDLGPKHAPEQYKIM